VYAAGEIVRAYQTIAGYPGASSEVIADGQELPELLDDDNGPLLNLLIATRTVVPQGWTELQELDPGNYVETAQEFDAVVDEMHEQPTYYGTGIRLAIPQAAGSLLLACDVVYASTSPTTHRQYMGLRSDQVQRYEVVEDSERHDTTGQMTAPESLPMLPGDTIVLPRMVVGQTYSTDSARQKIVMARRLWLPEGVRVPGPAPRPRGPAGGMSGRISG
jgi:hypothetical protein